MNYILYHANCYDGFGAAYVAWQYFGNDKAVYIPVSYGKTFPEEVLNSSYSNVYVLDFSYPKDELNDILDALMDNGSKMILIDHHDTTKKQLDGFEHPCLELHIDLERSGAGMAHDYFFPEIERPKMINFIEDRDLWNFNLEGTEQIHPFLKAHPMNFKVWQDLEHYIQYNTDKAIEQGAVVKSYQDQMVKMICGQARTVNWSGLKVALVTATSDWSEVGAHLLEKFPKAEVSISYHTLEDQSTKYSLRSRPDFKCSAIAEFFGGGGHPQASGFVLGSTNVFSIIGERRSEWDELLRILRS